MAFTGQRWIGRALPAPCQVGRPPAGGRQTYYGAVELAGEEVSLNDVVQTCRPGRSDGIPRLAQVRLDIFSPGLIEAAAAHVLLPTTGQSSCFRPQPVAYASLSAVVGFND